MESSGIRRRTKQYLLRADQERNNKATRIGSNEQPESTEFVERKIIQARKKGEKIERLIMELLSDKG